MFNSLYDFKRVSVGNAVRARQRILEENACSHTMGHEDPRPSNWTIKQWRHCLMIELGREHPDWIGFMRPG
ncbi:hypothetical protein H2O73_20890, partial [Vibrio sp. 404]|nr:hypothetical protein [Vibrio marinisediminis]